ncbi:hypothetical protein GCM10007932_43230 [Vibrio penaeicida]|uniref:Uncharacterized protein n=1 Tax=Vibrio penaeicida TaxID=104609 RepID=A0AAV5NW83_9VIBR|nr:hypothetical protein GCM10007932_43230 [Vibrio penaeicida]
MAYTRNVIASPYKFEDFGDIFLRYLTHNCSPYLNSRSILFLLGPFPIVIIHIDITNNKSKWEQSH